MNDKDTNTTTESQAVKPKITATDLKNHIADLVKSAPKAMEGLSEKESAIYERLQELYIDVSKPDEILPVCFEIIQSGEKIVVGTYGSLSLIKGKTKARKTFAATLFMGAHLTGAVFQNKIISTKPDNKKTVLHVDTEQSAYYAKPVQKRVLSLAGFNPNIKNENIFSIEAVGLNYLDRREYIEVAIKTIENLGLVVIDGVRDLMRDPNDQNQTAEVVEFLKGLAGKYFIHVICLLHENPGLNDKARGAIGTECEQKAETTYGVKKDGDISIIEPAFCRNKPFDPFAFSIDSNILPIIIDYNTPAKTDAKANKKVSVNSISSEIKKDLIIEVFKNDPKQGYANLISNLKRVYDSFGYPLTKDAAIDFKVFYEDSGIIKKEGPAGTRHCYYHLNIE